MLIFNEIAICVTSTLTGTQKCKAEHLPLVSRQ